MEIVRQPEGTMILRVHLGEGEVGDDKFSFGYNSAGLVWYFSNEGRYYTADFRRLTEDVLKFREREMEK